jgi:hypothetical protein
VPRCGTARVTQEHFSSSRNKSLASQPSPHRIGHGVPTGKPRKSKHKLLISIHRVNNQLDLVVLNPVSLYTVWVSRSLLFSANGLCCPRVFLAADFSFFRVHYLLFHHGGRRQTRKPHHGNPVMANLTISIHTEAGTMMGFVAAKHCTRRFSFSFSFSFLCV